MILRSENFSLFLIFASVVSSFIFCAGFFPYSVVKDVHHEESVRTPAKTESKIEKSILMIVDAIRLDFLKSESFSYVHELLNSKQGCQLQLSVNLPTVTKPRIKALTSGTIPSFLDVAMNFGDDEMKIDTFLHQLKKKGEKIVFAGDDTWKMFPFFDRQYANRDSLFVNDFYEGDQNVTESLKQELKRTDWKMLILHYLGLDHIGHVEGPFSKLVPPKLKEMDNVIKLIHEKLLEWNSGSDKKSILIVTGDHGMRDTGGHSGNSYAETHVPLLLIGCDCKSAKEKLYKQIDFAPTFSILNGLPIPESSIGTLIPEMLINMTKLQMLDSLKVINDRLLELVQTDGGDEFKLQSHKAKTFHQMFANDTNNNNAYKQAETNYVESSNKISEKLGKHSMDVNILQVLMGLAMNLLISFTLLIPSDGLLKDVKLTLKSFIPFIALAFFLEIFIFNDIFEQSNTFKSFFVVVIVSMVLRVLLEVIYSKFDRFKWFHLFDNDLLYLLMIGHVFFIASVGSSSFVEEEHQIWYYFCNTVFVYLAFFEMRGRTSLKGFMNALGKCFFFLLLHVFIRRMNQTGDKWLSVPDIGDWLHRDVNEGWLHLLIALSLMASATWLIVVLCSTSTTIPFILTGNVLLYFHHTRTINNRNDLPVTTLFWVNLCALIVFDFVVKAKSSVKKLTSFIIFFLVSLLLHQPQNLIMNFACAVTCWFLNRSCNRLLKNSRERTIAKIFLHFWAGKLFYFYQGNSNSLSTIDVNAGFVGQTHVHLPIIFIFSVINTFNAQLSSLFLLIIHLSEDSQRLNDETGFIMQLMCRWLALLTIIPTTVFLVVITILRHHLFIWSVFSPKLLYDFSLSLLLLVIVFIVKLVIKL